MIRVTILFSLLALALCKVATTKVTATTENLEQIDSTEEITTSEYPMTLNDFENHSGSFEVPHSGNSSEITQRSRRSDSGGCPNGWFKAIIEQYPYVVALYGKQGEYSCVGTILTPRLILTANHCISPDFLRPYSIRAHSADNQYGGEKHWVESVIRYPEANPDGSPFPHDIGLVLLKTKITNPTIVRLIDSQTPIYEGSVVLGVGWGKTRYQLNPRDLHVVPLQLCRKDKCEQEYKANNWICTETTKTSTCEGDSGGPIMCDGRQVGIVSHSNDQHCGSGIPTANAYVKKYLGWIQKNVKMYG